MKTLHLSIIVGAGIAIVLLSFLFIFYLPTSDNIQQRVANAGLLTQKTTVVIPPGSENQDSGKNYDPQHILVIIGVNNTVRWINDGVTMNSVVADNPSDSDFYNVTNRFSAVMENAKMPNFLKPGESFEYTFTKPGYFGYHGVPHPWQRGWVLVLPQDTKNLIQTVVLNDTDIIGPCAIFAIPCPNTHTFTAQKLGTNIYIEKMTINGVDNYVIVNPEGYCVYTYNSHKNSCTNSVDLAILRLVGAE